MSLDYNTLKHKKMKHLTLDERVLIYSYAQKGMSNGAIAKIIGCSKNTIRNESQRIANFTGVPWENYSPKEAQNMYDENRKHSRKDKQLKRSKVFLEYLYKNFNGPNHWSIDVACGCAKKDNLFDYVPTTKTVYNWINSGDIDIRYHELPEASSRKRKTGSKHGREYKNHLGESIENRPDIVDERTRFGDWEIDTVIGKKAGKNAVLLTLTERLTRYDIVCKIPGKTKEAVNTMVAKILSMFKDMQGSVFKTITADNGLEFAGLSEFDSEETKIYYAHPYSSYERGTNENLNKMVRRFLVKGIDMNNVPDYVVEEVEEWLNNLPRKILDYNTPEALFVQELDKIYRLKPGEINA